MADDSKDNDHGIDPSNIISDLPTDERIKFIHKELPGGMIYYGPEDEAPEELSDSEVVERIKKNHIQIVDAIQKINADIRSSVLANKSTVDPSGFRVHVFDASLYPAELIQNLESGEDMFSAFDIEFHSPINPDSAELFSARVVLSNGQSLDATFTTLDQTGFDDEEQKGTVMYTSIVVEAQNKGFAIGGIISKQLHTKDSLRNYGSEPKTGVYYNGEVPVDSAKDTLHASNYLIEEVTDLLTRFTAPNQKSFSARVFGNQDRRTGPQQPIFILPNNDALSSPITT
ncbi:MAG: hypothetical protein ABIO02_02540 [Patescibacteria group bacterium]